MVKPLAVLIVEDMESDAQLTVRMLTKAGYTLTFERVDSAPQMRAALEKQTWEIVISDFSMPGLDGFASLKVFQETGLDIPFIVVSGIMGEEIAVAMMKAGAHDYVMKSNLARLVPAVERELGQAEIRRFRKQVEYQKREREKELRTLFGLSMIIEREGITLDEIYQELINILPAGWQYPEIAYARIVVRGSEFCTKNFKKSTWIQSTPIKVDGTDIGKIEVGYLEKRLDRAEGPFLQEERELIDTIAVRMGRLIERKQTEEALSQQLSGLLKLNQFSIELSMLSSDDDIKELITRQIKDLSNAEVALFSSYDPVNRTITAHHIKAKPGLSKKVINLLGTQLKNIHTTVSEKMYREISKETIASRKTLYEASFGAVSRPVGEAIQALLNVDRFIGIAYLIDGKLQGTSLLGMSKDLPDPPRMVIENYILLAGWSIRRKRAEEEIQNLARFLSENPGPVLRIALDGTLLYINPNGLSLLPEWHLQAGQAAPPVLREAVLRILNNETIQDLDLEYGERVYSFHIVPIVVAGYANLYGRDITERIHAIENLRESENLFRTSFESSIAGISMVGLDGKYLRVNNKLCETLGYTQEELLHLPFNDITYEEDREVGSQYLKQMVAGELESVSFEKRYIKKDGNVIWVFLSIAAIRDKQNKLQYCVTYTQDITERKTSVEKLRRNVEGTINTIALIVEARDPYTSGHQKRVAEISVAIAEELGLPEEQIQGIYFSSLIHDVGKIGVPSEILSKPGKLTKLEFDIIKTHSKVGYELLKEIDFSWPIAEIVHQHHEKMDGSGYPRKLKGDRIIIEAKIICVADVIEAMSSHRPYRPALGSKAAMDEIIKNKGILYDAKVVEAFLKVIKKDKPLLPSP